MGKSKRINRIAFEGNKRLADEVLDAEVTLRPRVVYTRTKVQNDVKRLLDIYRRSGRFGAMRTDRDPRVRGMLELDAWS